MEHLIGVTATIKSRQSWNFGCAHVLSRSTPFFVSLYYYSFMQLNKETCHSHL